MIICGTGHRPDKVGGYSADAYDRLYGLAGLFLRNTKPSPSFVISGMALGWDQALADASIDLQIPVIAYIPFLGQECKWPKESRETYAYLMSRVESIKECSEPGYAPWKMQYRNQMMVDDADVVLALWDGSDGGTANCVRYAEKAKKQVVNLWPVYDMIRKVNSHA